MGSFHVIPPHNSAFTINASVFPRGLPKYLFELRKLQLWIRVKFLSASMNVISCVVNEGQGSIKIRYVVWV